MSSEDNSRNIGPRKPEKCYKHSAIKYTVQKGDTFYSIATKHKMQPRDLILNSTHIQNPSHLIPGDVLCIPKQVKLCTFLYPTKKLPKKSYAVVANLNGITCIANLPSFKQEAKEYNSYCCYAIGLNEYKSVKLSQISTKPSIWIGEIKGVTLQPHIRIVISVNKGVEPSEPPGDLVLFESR